MHVAITKIPITVDKISTKIEIEIVAILCSNAEVSHPIRGVSLIGMNGTIVLIEMIGVIVMIEMIVTIGMIEMIEMIVIDHSLPIIDETSTIIVEILMKEVVALEVEDRTTVEEGISDVILAIGPQVRITVTVSMNDAETHLAEINSAAAIRLGGTDPQKTIHSDAMRVENGLAAVGMSGRIFGMANKDPTEMIHNPLVLCMIGAEIAVGVPRTASR